MSQYATAIQKRIRIIQPIIRKFRVGEEPKENIYWKSVPYEERLRALEEIRCSFLDTDHDTQSRLQRVYSIIK